jgi:hypothetical protein
MKRLRKLFDSIVFAGMKPGVRPGPQGTSTVQQGEKKMGPVERFLSRPAHVDPLYLTNRSLTKRIKYWSLVAIPCVVVIGLVALTLSRDYFDQPKAAPPKELSQEELARKTLPNIATDLTIDSNKDVEVTEVHVDQSGMRVTGTIRNKTAHGIAVADVIFNLTDKAGSQVGAVSSHIENLAPKSTKDFQFPIKQQNAAFVLVRELNTSR